MKNNEQISHIPQTGTHHDKTHTRLMLWIKGIMQLCLTRNHLEQDHCFGCAQGSHGTNEHAKIQQSLRHFWVFSILLEMSKCIQEQSTQLSDLTPNPFKIHAVKSLFPSLPLKPKRHIIFENMLQNSQGQRVWHRLWAGCRLHIACAGASSGEAALAAFHLLNGV